jgi:hypothetical protein
MIDSDGPVTATTPLCGYESSRFYATLSYIITYRAYIAYCHLEKKIYFKYYVPNNEYYPDRII